LQAGALYVVHEEVPQVLQLLEPQVLQLPQLLQPQPESQPQQRLNNQPACASPAVATITTAAHKAAPIAKKRIRFILMLLRKMVTEVYSINLR
jgi:hypothetical protein